jgi:hypothetical protein
LRNLHAGRIQIMTNYFIWIVTPYSHSQCFSEAAQSLQSAFIELGHGCEVVTEPPMQRENVVILGAHLLHPGDLGFLKKPIVWNLEQMPGEGDDRNSAPLTSIYLSILKQADVWDYSRRNQEELLKLGIASKLLEVGYSPCLTRIENVPDPDIDVLFVGSLNERRAHILRELQANDVKVVHAFDCYGVKRDALVARSKVVLNCHFYEAKLFEVVRVSYMLANRKCVVSEYGLDGDLERPYYGAVVFTGYENLVEECLSMLRDDTLRSEWEMAGFDRIRERSQVGFLRRVL